MLSANLDTMPPACSTLAPPPASGLGEGHLVGTNPERALQTLLWTFLWQREGCWAVFLWLLGWVCPRSLWSEPHTCKVILKSRKLMVWVRHQSPGWGCPFCFYLSKGVKPSLSGWVLLDHARKQTPGTERPLSSLLSSKQALMSLHICMASPKFPRPASGLFSMVLEGGLIGGGGF